MSGWSDKSIGDLCRYKLFSSLMDSAFLTHYESKRASGDRNMHSPMYYIKELCSIKLNIGRNVGKTQQIVNRCLPGDVILCTNSISSSYIKEKLREAGKNPDNYVIMTAPPHVTNFAESNAHYNPSPKLAAFVFANKHKSINVWCDDSAYSANYNSILNNNFCQYLYDNYETIRVVHLG